MKPAVPPSQRTPPGPGPRIGSATRVSWLLVLGALTVAGLGCGTTQVFADDPMARIWANGQLVGRGHAQIKRTGFPETTAIRVETEDGRKETTTVKRSVTGLTVLGALFTYGTCLIFCWQYPETVWAALPAGPRSGPAAPMGEVSARDPWLDPDPGWRDVPAAPTATSGIPPGTAATRSEGSAAPPPPPNPATPAGTRW
jgi:hypothetical protein